MKLIGQGVSSCVITPPYSCKTQAIPKKSIGKVLPHKKAVEEETKYKIVNSLDPKRIFSPKKVFRCPIEKNIRQVFRDLKDIECRTFIDKEDKIRDLEQIVMTYHGKPLHKSDLMNIHTRRKNNEQFETYIRREIMRLLYCGSVLRSHKLSHLDLHAGNILVNEQTGKFTVIDFGELTQDKHVYTYVKDRVFTKKDYTQFPPELVIISEILSHKNKNEIVNSIKTMNTRVKSLLHEGLRTGRGSSYLVQAMNEIQGLKSIVNIMDPTEFPSMVRDNLYSLRCGSLLCLNELLRMGHSFSYICALCFVTIDSYAIGTIIHFILRKVTLTEHTFVRLQSIAERMCSLNIHSRMSSREALIDIKKE
jgi:serine/threonine protein kinase